MTPAAHPTVEAGASAPGTGQSTANEARLLEQLRAGDSQAYEYLIRAHGGSLLAAARRLLRTEEDAHDAVQDAFLSAFRSLDRFEGGCRLSTWLHQIVINAALMKLRSRRRKNETSIDELLPRFAEDGHWASSPSEWSATAADTAIERRETRLRVREAIDRLPETYRTVLVLRDIEELDTEETARALGITPNAVKVRLHRARMALRTLLDPMLAKP